jgi:L-rhamnose mutarotase
MTERVGHVWRVKPGRADDYRERHRSIWPELDALLRSAGVRSYTIYLHGDLVFSHMEVDDYRRMLEKVAADPVAIRWEEQFEDILEYRDVDMATGWPRPAVEVWNLNAESGSRRLSDSS